MGNGKMQDKVAIISGGCGGVGLEVSRLFVQEGARMSLPI